MAVQLLSSIARFEKVILLGLLCSKRSLSSSRESARVLHYWTYISELEMLRFPDLRLTRGWSITFVTLDITVHVRGCS